MVKSEEILKVLNEYNLISQTQLAGLVSEAQADNKSIVDILLDKKIIDAEGLAKINAKIANFPYANLLEADIGETVLNIIPNEVAENYKIICFEKSGNKTKVGIVDPDNFKALEAIDFLAKEAGLTVEYYLISEASFRTAVKKYKTLDKELSTALETREKEEKDELSAMEEKKTKEEAETVTKSAPVAKIVSVIIRHAVEGGASDIHIEPLFKETRVRYRIDGILHTTLVLPRTVHNSVVARIKVMSNLKLDETRVPQDGRIRLSINEVPYDFRVSILPVVGGKKW